MVIYKINVLCFLMTGYSDADDNHSVSAVSADSASFHTPEPYEMSSQDEEDVDLSVEVSIVSYCVPDLLRQFLLLCKVSSIVVK